MAEPHKAAARHVPAGTIRIATASATASPTAPLSTSATSTGRDRVVAGAHGHRRQPRDDLLRRGNGPVPVRGDGAGQGRFGSVLEILAHDPVRILRTYLSDLKDLLLWLPESVALPLSLAVVPGLVWLVAARTDRTALLVLGAFALHAALINLKAFEPRFYLFAIPLMIAGLAASAGLVLGATAGRRPLAAGLAGLLLVAGIANAVTDTSRAIAAETHEIADLLDAA